MKRIKGKKTYDVNFDLTLPEGFGPTQVMLEVEIHGAAQATPMEAIKDVVGRVVSHKHMMIVTGGGVIRAED